MKNRLKKMKCVLTLILVLCTLVNTTFPAFAADSGEVCAVAPYSEDATLIEVTRDGAPIRTGAGEKYSTVITCSAGTVLEKTGRKMSKSFNTFYEVTYRDSSSNKCYTGYIYEKNTTKHSHSFEKFEYEGITYKFCDCGKITVRVKNEYQIKKADAIALAGGAAGAMAVGDGLFPLGDILGVGLLVSAGVLTETGVLPKVDEIAAVYEDIDFKKLNDDDDSCPIDSYRKVIRTNGTLKYLDDDCMSIVEAYVWVRTGHDVWCRDWDTAAKLASLHLKGSFSEIDSSNKDYWYHFHLGSITPNGKHVDVVGGHIFYGTSALTHRLPS